jgi:hypothetical protein
MEFETVGGTIIEDVVENDDAAELLPHLGSVLKIKTTWHFKT